uniref:C2 domain-containing protein n=1 Tax=Anolis carolinensis TaxID=28377 RepID=A0A803TFX5_ANOCA|nr:PREDICTED: copine-6-like [Anolis carolinensis]|eukprot:XP_008123515.2 PREDICTED: copine-6-like [Anolis carolinensis]
MSEGVDSQPVALGASRVELRVSCWSLPQRGSTIKPDPCLVLQLLSGKQWNEVGRSEVLHRSQNPVFAHVFALDYFFEEMQTLRFEVFDADGEDAENVGLEEGGLLGTVECTLGQVRTVLFPMSCLPWLSLNGTNHVDSPFCRKID